jgi:hypothetical protein
VALIRDHPDDCFMVGRQFYRPDGTVMVNRRNLQHRLVRELYRRLIGVIGSREYLHQYCSTVGCQNPRHYKVSRAANPYPPACRHGHPYTIENTREGQYKCVQCWNDLLARRRAAYHERKNHDRP